MNRRALFLALVVAASPACFDQGGCITQNVNPTKVDVPPTPAPSPSPSPTPTPSPSASPRVTCFPGAEPTRLFLAVFAWSGVEPRPANQQQPYPLKLNLSVKPDGSAADRGTLTVTPKGAPIGPNAPNGDVPPEVGGTDRLGGRSPKWTVDDAAVLGVTVDDSNEDGYNVELRPKKPGSAIVHVDVFPNCGPLPILSGEWSVTVS